MQASEPDSLATHPQAAAIKAGKLDVQAPSGRVWGGGGCCILATRFYYLRRPEGECRRRVRWLLLSGLGEDHSQTLEVG